MSIAFVFNFFIYFKKLCLGFFLDYNYVMSPFIFLLPIPSNISLLALYQSNGSYLFFNFSYIYTFICICMYKHIAKCINTNCCTCIILFECKVFILIIGEDDLSHSAIFDCYSLCRAETSWTFLSHYSIYYCSCSSHIQGVRLMRLYEHVPLALIIFLPLFHNDPSLNEICLFGLTMVP